MPQLVRTDKSRLVNMVLEHFEQSRRAREPWVDMWLRCYQLYRGYREELPEDEEDRSNLHIPKVFSHIETILPRTVAATFSHRPWVTIQPRTPDDERGAKLHEELFEYQAEKQDLFVTMVKFYKEALFYGTAIGKNVWRYETTTRKMRVRKPFMFGMLDVSRILGLEPVYEVIEKEVVLWDDPWFEHIDLFDFYPDPDGPTIERMEWGIHRSFDNLKNLRKAGIYKNLDKVEELSGHEEDRGSDQRLAEIGRGFTPDATGRSRPIELLEHWEDDRVIVVANRSVVIRDDDNPFWHGRKPFIAMTDTPLPHEFYGVGSIEPIRFLQEEINARRNQRMDNVSLALHRMFVAARNAGINPADLVWRPGGTIWVDAMDDVNKLVQPITVPDVTASSYEEELIMNKDMEDATGASDFARGNMPTRGATATEIQQLTQATAARVDLKVRLMAHQGLRAIARDWVALNQQFMTPGRSIRIAGKEWVKVFPEDIAGEYDFIPGAANVESFANREVKRASILEALKVTANEIDMPYVNRPALLRRLMELYDFSDVDEIIQDPKQPGLPQTPTEATALALLQGGIQSPQIAGGVPSVRAS